MTRRSPKKRWLLAVIGWTMLGSAFIYLQYKLDYRAQQQTSDVASAMATAAASNILQHYQKGRGSIAGNGGTGLQQPDDTSYLPADLLPLERSKRGFNESCAILPTLFDLKINNVYWQHLVAEDGTNFYLYGAYYDNRSLTDGHPQVRILGMTDRIPPPPTSCHFWYEGKSKPTFSSNATTYHYIWHPKRGNSKNGTLQPVLLNCPLPVDEAPAAAVAADVHSAPPIVVSLVERVCDNATNALKVASSNVVDRSKEHSKDDDRTTRPSIAVCVKGLNYLQEDRSVRLVEWLELLRILGVDRVFMYELSVHSNMSKVLRHYERQGFVDVRPLTLPGDQINEPRLRALYLAKRIIHKRQNELIPYNDCLYRNLRRYDYVALLDIDEVIVPMAPNATTWQQMVARADDAADSGTEQQRRVSLCAQHVYFFDNASSDVAAADNYPPYLHMLTHVRRARNFTKPWQYVKCLHDTRQVITLHNHFPIECRHHKCPIVTMDVRHGRLHHYRKGCTIGLEDVCAKNFMSDTVVDDAVLQQYGEQLAARSKMALKKLGFLT